MGLKTLWSAIGSIADPPEAVREASLIGYAVQIQALEVRDSLIGLLGRPRQSPQKV